MCELVEAVAGSEEHELYDEQGKKGLCGFWDGASQRFAEQVVRV